MKQIKLILIGILMLLSLGFASAETQYFNTTTIILNNTIGLQNETATIVAGPFAQVADISYTGTSNTYGYISSVILSTSNIGSDWDGDIVVKNGLGTVIANKSVTIPDATSNIATLFSESDYSDLLVKGESFTIDATKTSGGLLRTSTISNSFTGTLFDLDGTGNFEGDDAVFTQSGQDVSSFIYSGNVTSLSTKNNGVINGKTFNDGTLTNFDDTNRTQSVNSSYGGSLEFDGSDDYVDIGTNVEITTGCLWVKNNLGLDQYYYLSSNTHTEIFGIRTSNVLAIYESGWKSFSYFPSTNWEYQCIVYNGAAYDLYVNGSYISTAVNSNKIRYEFISGTSTNSMNGTQDEVRIWTTDLNSTQIINEMNSGTPVNGEDLVASYSSNENKGNVLYDTNHIVKGVETNVNNIENNLFNYSPTGKAMFFDGINDVIEASTAITSYPFTLSAWFKTDNLADDSAILMLNDASSDVIYYGISYDGNTGKLQLDSRAGGSSSQLRSTTLLNSNEWVYVVGEFISDSEKRLYINGGLEATDTNSIVFNANVDINLIGLLRKTSPTWYAEGLISNANIYNRTLNQIDINNLYYSGLGNLTQQINTTGLTFNTNFQEMRNTDISDRNNALCINCQSVITNETYNEGLYTLFATDVTLNETISNNFFVDITNPSLQVNLPSNITSYNINFTQYINFSDALSGVQSCVVEISGESNSSCSNESYMFSTNGNKTINVTLIDNAGNTNTSVNNQLQVLPDMFFRFFDVENSTFVSNYTFGGYASNGTYTTIPLFDLGFGNHTLLFTKEGYIDQNFTVSINNSGPTINITFVVGLSQLNIRIFDRDTLQLIQPQIVNLELVNDVGNTFGLNFTTTTGTYQVIDSSFTLGNYILRAQTSTYNLVERYFTFNGRQNTTIDLYMLQSNKTDPAGDPIVVPVKMIVQTVDGFDVGSNAVVKVLQQYANLDGTSLLVDSSRTNANGEVLFELEFNSILYSVLIEYKDEVFRFDSFKVTRFGETCISGAQCYFFLVGSTVDDEDIYFNKENIDFNLRFINLTNNSDTGYIQFNFNNRDNVVDTYCLDVFRKEVTEYNLINTTCIDTSTGTINTIINETDIFQHKGQGYLLDDDGNRINLGVKYVINPALNLEWGNYGLFGAIIMTLITLGIGAAAFINGIDSAPSITIGLIVISLWVQDRLGMVLWGDVVLISITLISFGVLWALNSKR